MHAMEAHAEGFKLPDQFGLETGDVPISQSPQIQPVREMLIARLQVGDGHVCPSQRVAGPGIDVRRASAKVRKFGEIGRY